MARSVFGWHYPAGAEHDPNAPWNQPIPKCEECKHDADDCVCVDCPSCGDRHAPSGMMEGLCENCFHDAHAREP